MGINLEQLYMSGYDIHKLKNLANLDHIDDEKFIFDILDLAAGDLGYFENGKFFLFEHSIDSDIFEDE
jgi:hypothetical protein